MTDVKIKLYHQINSCILCCQSGIDNLLTYWAIFYFTRGWKMNYLVIEVDTVLHPLFKEDMIAITIPENPGHVGQRYVATKKSSKK